MSTKPKSYQTFTWHASAQCLEIDWGNQLGFSCRQLVYGWGDGLVALNFVDGSQELLSLKGFAEMLFDASETPAITAWRNTFPEWVWGRFRKLSSHRAQLAQFMSRHVELCDLMTSNYGLAWMWFEYCRVYGHSREVFIAGVKKKQHKIFSMMGLCSHRSGPDRRRTRGKTRRAAP